MNIIVHRTAPVVVSVPSPDLFRVSFRFGSEGASQEHTHEISDVNGLQTALDAKSDAGHTHTIDDVTGLQTALDNKSNIGHTHTISGIDGLQSELDGKSDDGHSHIITDITGLETALNDKADIGRIDPFFEMYRHLGSTAKSTQPYMMGTQASLVINSSTTRFLAVYVPEDCTVTGVMFILRTSGVYVANTGNIMALYSIDASTGVLTLLASTPDTADMYVAVGSTNNMQFRAFSAPVNITRGVYYVALGYRHLSVTTNPQLSMVNSIPQPIYVYDLPNSIKVSGQLSGITFPSTVASSSLATHTQPFWANLY